MTAAVQLRWAQIASLITLARGSCCALRKLHKRAGSFALCWSDVRSISALWPARPQHASMIAQRCNPCTDWFQAAGAAGRSQSRRSPRIYCFQTTDKQTAKQNLKFAIGPTQRGGSASTQQRGVVLEAQVGCELTGPEWINTCTMPVSAERRLSGNSEFYVFQVELESFSNGLDYDLLPGKWKLVYTSAPDVAPLVVSNGFSSLLPVKVGDIYQEFSTVALGQVKNIITFQFAGLLESGNLWTFLYNRSLTHSNASVQPLGGCMYCL